MVRHALEHVEQLVESIDKPLYDQMHQRLQTRKAKIYKKLRSSTVEPVLGTLINFTGMRRIWTRGIEQANKFMLGAAIAYNLKKWLNYKPKTRKVEEMIDLNGLEKVNGEHSLICLVYNIKRSISILGFEKLMEKLNNWKPNYKGILWRIQKLLQLEAFYAFQNFEHGIAA